MVLIQGDSAWGLYGLMVMDEPGVVAQGFNPSARGRGKQTLEFEVSLIYKASPGQPGLYDTEKPCL